MAIDRDDREERQARLDWMINEFQEARRKRFAKGTNRVVELLPKADAKAVSTEQAPSQ
jgi:hypothetical protein